MSPLTLELTPSKELFTCLRYLAESTKKLEHIILLSISEPSTKLFIHFNPKKLDPRSI